jgi:hypothetical protein
VPSERCWWTFAGLAIGVVASLVLELHFNHLGGILRGRWEKLAVLGAWWVAFALAAWCLLHVPRRPAVGLLFAGTILFNAAALTAGPQLSDDLYRYAWDGRVQAAGIDPYRYPPDDPRLASLRDDWLWPDPAECADIGRAPGCTRLNRPSERTIYPPVAQVWFRLLDLLLPGDAEEKGLQVVHGLVGVALVALIVAVLRDLGGDPRWAVLYAWSPLAIVEATMDAHVDVVAATLAVAALWVLNRGRHWLSGALLGAATGIKLLPALVLPVALRARPLRVASGAIVVMVVAYLPHVLALGLRVLGYLPGYLQEERYDDGGRFLLLGLVGLDGSLATVAAVAVGAATLWVVMSREDHTAAGRARQLVGVAFLVATPVQPWYATLLIAIAVLEGAWQWLFVAAAGYPLYFAEVLDAPARPVGVASYGIAALVVVAVGLRRRLTTRSMGHERWGEPERGSCGGCVRRWRDIRRSS